MTSQMNKKAEDSKLKVIKIHSNRKQLLYQISIILLLF